MTEKTSGIREALVSAIPNLRAFALSLTGDHQRAADLVQETLLKAWAHRTSFQPGTNFKAWTLTILRNTFYSEIRKLRHEVQDTDGGAAAKLVSTPSQDGHVDLADVRRALDSLVPSQREALLLVCAEGFSYKEAAQISGCAIGTVKSRVNRARVRIAELTGSPPSPVIDSGEENSRTNHRRSAAACVIRNSSASVVFVDEENANEGRHDMATATVHPNTSLISSEDVEGTAVYGTTRSKVGDIDHLMIDKISGQVTYAVMSFGGFMGLGHSHYPVPWKALKYDSSLGGYVTGITESQLRDAPEFSDDSWGNRDWESRVHSHYGTPPYWA